MRVVQAAGIFALGLVGGTALGYWLKKPASPVAHAQVETVAIAQTKATSPAIKPTGNHRGRRHGPRSEEEEQALDAVTDPRAWLEAWVANGAPPEQGKLASDLVARWAETDVQAALQFVMQAPRFPDRIRALVYPLAALGKADILSAQRWILSNLAWSDRQEIAGSVVKQIGETNLAEALQLAFVPDIPVSSEIFGDLIGRLVITDSSAALAYFHQLSERGRAKAAEQLVHQWYNVDPAAVLRWVQSQREESHGSAVRAAYLQTVVSVAPGKFAEAIQQIGANSGELSASRFPYYSLSTDAKLALLPHLQSEERARFLEGIVDDEIQRAPELAWRLACDSVGETEAAKCFGNAWLRWQASDRKAAQDWLAAADSPAMQAAKTHTSRLVEASENPQTFLASLNSSNRTASDAELIERAIIEINATDPAAAAGWLTKLNTTVSASTAETVAMFWMVSDQVAVLQWINSLPAGTQRDAALGGTVKYWLSNDELSKVGVAISNITDAERRTQVYWSTFELSYNRNKEAAIQWLATQPISQEVKDSWLSILRSRQ